MMSMTMYKEGERITKEEIKSIIFASEEQDPAGYILQNSTGM